MKSTPILCRFRSSARFAGQAESVVLAPPDLAARILRYCLLKRFSKTQ
jgi:hypothetical protein